MSFGNGGPAFPVQEYNADGSPASLSTGMTLRDYFAAKALPAVYAEYCREMRLAGRGWLEGWRDGIANDAYRMADAMLAERIK